MAPPRLIFHVGHPKTGTSALQSSFALSIDDLRRAGVHYPRPPMHKAAEAGQVTSGNLNAVRVAERYRAERRHVPPGGAMLLSNEAAFRIFPKHPEGLVELRDAGVPIEIVLFLRDPIALSRSVFAQSVQRHGQTRPYDVALASFAYLDRVEEFLDCMDGLGLPMSMRKYDSAPGAMRAAMEDILALPPGTLRPAPIARVNRSCSRAEIAALQEIIAEHGPEAAGRVGDAWVRKLPDVAPDPPRAGASVYAAFASRIAPQIARLNLRLPDAAHYRLESFEDAFGPDRGPVPLTPAHHALRIEALRPGAARAPLTERLAAALIMRTPRLAYALRYVRDRIRR